MNDDLKDKLRALRLPRLAAHWDEDLKEAARQRMSHATLLTHIVEEEYRLKCDRARQQRLVRARLGLFFTLIQKRHRKKSTLLTSNLGFSEWGSFLKNDHLTAALIDRLTEASHVFNLKECVTLRGKLSADP